MTIEGVRHPEVYFNEELDLKEHIKELNRTLKTLFAGNRSFESDVFIDNNLRIRNGYLRLDKTVYDDLQVSMSNIKKGSTAPTDCLYNYGIAGGVTFNALGFAVGDFIFFDLQTTHSMKLSTILDHHIHFTLPQANDPADIGDRFQFQLDVIVAAIDGTWTVSAGSPFTSEYVVALDDEKKHRYFDLASIPAFNTSVSSIAKCKLTRIAASTDEYGSDVYLQFTDSHIEKDCLGSSEENAREW